MKRKRHHKKLPRLDTPSADESYEPRVIVGKGHSARKEWLTMTVIFVFLLALTIITWYLFNERVS